MLKKREIWFFGVIFFQVDFDANFSYFLSNMENDKALKIPVLFHNWTNFDGALILAGLDKNPKLHHIGGLAKNSQKLRVLSLNSYRVFDSLAHLPSVNPTNIFKA